MKYREFLEQDNHCRENNTPEGTGCDGCPASDKKHCADALRNLCGKWLDALRTGIGLKEISSRMEKDYGISQYGQLRLVNNVIELRDG